MKLKKIFWWLFLNATSVLWGRVGKKCYIGRPHMVTGSKNIFLGNMVRIYPGARLECGPQGKIVFGNNISIGPNVNITAFGVLKIQSGTTISANVFITDMDHDFNDPNKSVMDTKNIIKKTEIGENCFVGANSVILAGSDLSNGVVVGANSTVRGAIPKNRIVSGSPARVKRNR